jgi:hypothetical protein
MLPGSAKTEMPDGFEKRFFSGLAVALSFS